MQNIIKKLLCINIFPLVNTYFLDYITVSNTNIQIMITYTF